MRFLQVVAVLIFLALIGNLLKPLYWDRLEDLLRARSDFGPDMDGTEDTTGGSGAAGGYVTRPGFERFRQEVRERYARSSDLERVRRDLQDNYVRRENLNEQIASAWSALDSLSQALRMDYLSRAQVDSLMKGFVRGDRFVALQGVVQGLHRARGGGGTGPAPVGRVPPPRRNLWKGYHQVHPPYLPKTGGDR